MYPANTGEFKPGSGITQYYKNTKPQAINGNCVGDKNVFNTPDFKESSNITKDLLSIPLDNISKHPACSINYDKSKEMKLNINGQYCENGMNTMTNNCLGTTSDIKENFTDSTSELKTDLSSSNTISMPYYGLQNPTNNSIYDIYGMYEGGQTGNHHFCGDLNLPIKKPSNSNYQSPRDDNSYNIYIDGKVGGEVIGTCVDNYDNSETAGGQIHCTQGAKPFPCCHTRIGHNDPHNGYLRFTKTTDPTGRKSLGGIIGLNCVYPPSGGSPPSPGPSPSSDKKITGKILLWTDDSNFRPIYSGEICTLIERHSNSSTGKGCNNFDIGLGEDIFGKGNCPLKSGGCGLGDCQLVAISHQATGVKITPYYLAVSGAGLWPPETKMCTEIVPWYTKDGNTFKGPNKTPIPPMAQMVYFKPDVIPCALKFEFADGGECP